MYAKTSRTIGRSSVSPVSARAAAAVKIRSSHASRVMSTGLTTSLPEIRRTNEFQLRINKTFHAAIVTKAGIQRIRL